MIPIEEIDVDKQVIEKLSSANIQTLDDIWKEIDLESEQDVEAWANSANLRFVQLLEVLSKGLFKTAASCDLEITSITELWAAVGEDFDSGIDSLAEQIGLGRAELTGLLVAIAKYEVEQEEFLQFGDREAGLRSSLAWLKRCVQRAVSLIQRNWLEALLVIGLLVLGSLALRDAGVFLKIPGAVVVSDTDLSAGDVLRSNTLHQVRYASHDSFTDTAKLTGLMLANDISRGVPIRYRDVLRPQVVALTSIFANTIIAGTSVTLTWTLYEPQAQTNLEQVVGHEALENIRNGQVIRSDSVSVDSVLVNQVVVSATAGLEAFQIIGPKDVKLTPKPPEAGTFADIQDVMGRYPLSRIRPGEILHLDQISDIEVTEATLDDRVLIPISIKGEAFIPGVQSGSRVSLVLYPVENSITTDESLIVDDVILMATYPNDDKVISVVAVSRSALPTLTSFLGRSEAIVLRSVR